jgi:glycosyltransferase involved in cell wall biosynthesis
LKPYSSENDDGIDDQAGPQSGIGRGSADAVAKRIAILLPSLEGGGAERSMLNLANAFVARGRKVDLVLCRVKGAYLEHIPPAVQLRALSPTGTIGARLLVLMLNLHRFITVMRPVVLPSKTAPEIQYVVSLRRYLREQRPDAVLSALTYANLTALWARRISGVSVPIVVSERISLSQHCFNASNRRKWRWRFLPPLVGKSYPEADAIVAVSNHVADDLAAVAGVQRDSVTTIYNPVVDDKLYEQANAPLEHPWFAPGSVPVILGVGRLTDQKDFPTLLRAFARVRARRKVRLVILGEGKLRSALEDMIAELGLQADVQLPGFVQNPFNFMAKAAVLALSSLYEGLPGVLIQALACGCPVVSTNCPGGSAEILDDGKIGPLVTPGDDAAFAEALESVLDDPPDKSGLRERAELFSTDRASEQYLGLLDDLAASKSKC